MWRKDCWWVGGFRLEVMGLWGYGCLGFVDEWLWV